MKYTALILFLSYACGAQDISSKLLNWATATAWVTTTYDATQTSYALSHGANEDNPLFGKHPSNARIYGQMFGETILLTVVSRRLNKRHRGIATTLMVALTAVHTAGISYTLANGCGFGQACTPTPKPFQ